MYKNTKEDIFNGEIEHTYIALISNKTKVGIIGGGKAGAIKAKTFLKKGCYVEVLSKSFDEYFKNLHIPNIKINRSEYTKGFLKGKHIIIIAVDDIHLAEKIQKHCEEEFKVFINATDFKESMAVIPVQRSTNSLSVAISTKVGNPKGSILVSEEVCSVLNKYDNFIAFTGMIRNNAKGLEKYKEEIINFVNTNDFMYMYLKKKEKYILTMFFDRDMVEKLYGK